MKRNVHWNGSRRGWLTLLILLVVIPATIYLCYRAGGRVYYLASVLIILYTMVPFFLVFEHRKPPGEGTGGVGGPVCHCRRVPGGV